MSSADTKVSWLEQVRRNAARFVCNGYNNYNVSSSELVLSLGWEALEVRRSICFISDHKFYNGLVPCTLPNCISISGLGSTTSIRRHMYSLQQLHISVLAFSYFFFPKCIRIQNLLSSQVVNATSLNCFKAAAGSQKLKVEVNQRIFIDCNLATAPSTIRANKLFR